MNSDGKVLTNAQRQKLCEMMFEALLELRMLGWAGKSQQAGDLADAFHNVPIGIWRDDFSLTFFRNSFVGAYQRKYPETRDYVAMVDAIIAMGD